MPIDLAERLSSGGATQSGLRDFNERLLLTLLQRQGPMPGSALARKAGLSAQTVSVILRKLERDEVILRGEPQRGKVGKPTTPMRLNPDGAFAFGVKIGRRSTDLALMDLHGKIRAQVRTQYVFPAPDEIFAFLTEHVSALTAALPPAHAARIAGMGIAAPFELWNWHEVIGARKEDTHRWHGLDLAAEAARLSGLPTVLVNDATAACHAENTFGTDHDLLDYAYLFIGSLIGGGIVLGGTVHEGRTGNAGAFGPLQTVTDDGTPAQLLDTASLFLLDAAITRAGGVAGAIWQSPDDWSAHAHEVTAWTRRAAREMAKGVLQMCAVLDFEAVVVDGAMPPVVRRALVERIRAELPTLDTRGLVVPRIVEGAVGANARVMGAAYSLIFTRLFLSGRQAA